MKGLISWNLLQKYSENEICPQNVQNIIEGLKNNPLVLTKESSFEDFQQKFWYVTNMVPSFEDRVDLFKQELLNYSSQCDEITLHFSGFSLNQNTLTNHWVSYLKNSLASISNSIKTNLILCTQRKYLSNFDSLKSYLTAVEPVLDLIDGFGLVGNENVYVPNKILNEYIHFSNQNRMPCRFHLGETKFSEQKLDEILTYLNGDYIDSIAHACCLYSSKENEKKSSYPLDIIRERKIPIEVCPTSNMYLCGLRISDFKRLVDLDLEYIIGSDNPVIFSTSISKEMNFWNKNVLNF